MAQTVTVRKKNMASVAQTLALLFVVVFGVWLFVAQREQSSTASLETYIEQIEEVCSEARYRPACYDEEIPKLLDVISMEEAFAVGLAIQRKDEQYNYCHVLGHELSERETAKDPSKWTEVLHRCPNNVCSNGCLHGAAIGRFRDGTLTPKELERAKQELQTVCEPTDGWDPTGLAQAECVHGLGHLSMYITDADIPKALELCADIAVTSGGRDMTSLCYEGVFMQLFQPLEEEDEALVAGLGPQRKENLRSFCEQFETTPQIEACWQEGWPWYREELRQADGVREYCEQSSTPEVAQHCYSMLFYVNAQGAQYDADTLEVFCNGFQDRTVRGNCFGQVANAMIHGGTHYIGTAVSFCRRAETRGVAQQCYALLDKFAEYNLSANTPEYVALCNGIPLDLRRSCVAS